MEIWTVTQVIWKKHCYAITAHDSYTDAWSMLTVIFGHYRDQGDTTIEVHSSDHLSGDGWEACITSHNLGEDDANIQREGIPPN